MVGNVVIYRNVASVVKKSLVLAAGKTQATKKERIQVCNEIAHGLADYFARDNKGFDSARFLRDCGITS